MKKSFLKLSKLWVDFAFAVGDLVSSVVLTIFYYSIFALVALPYRVFSGSFNLLKNSNWQDKNNQAKDLGSLTQEF